jgi:hypothetical protein
MLVKISGEGNFERVVTPPLEEPNAWRAYDAEEEFTASDDIGLSGAKVFKLPVAPTMAREAMPVFAFSFFDPETATYQILRNSPGPLTVIGAPAAPVTPPPPVAVATVAPAVPATPPASQEPQDILGILPQMGEPWKPGPLASSRVLFGLLAAPLPLLLILGWWWRRRGDPAAARLADLRRQKSALHARIRQSSERAEVLDAAARLLQIEAAMTTGQPATGLDLAAVLAARRVPPSAVPALESLFSARADLLYAGGGRAESLSTVERDRVLEAIATYEGSAAR